MHALRWLGADRNLAQRSRAPRNITIADGPSGRRLTEYPLGSTIAEQHDAPYLIAARATLRDVLLSHAKAAAGVDLRFGVRIEGVASQATSVTLTTVGRDETFDGWVGADGIGSFARRHITSSAQPDDTGWVAWRALVPVTALKDADATELHLGPDAHVVAYAIDDEIANLVVILAKGRHPQEAVADWTGLESLLGEATDWSKWAIGEVACDSADWVDGPIALVGDAAHATVPYAAQGAAMALEDAVVLVQSCERHRDDLPEAFLAYQAARRERVSKVANLAHANRRIYHMRAPLAWGRDMVMRTMPTALMQSRMDWVYGWRPPGP